MRGIILTLVTAILTTTIGVISLKADYHPFKAYANECNKCLKKEIIITPKEIAYQGDTVKIVVKSPQALNKPYFIYKGRRFDLFSKGQNDYEGFLGLSAFEKTGDFRISLKDSTGYLNDKRLLKVRVKRYPNQYITLSGKKGGLTATRRELRKVGSAKGFLSNVAHWTQPPFTNPTEGCVSSVYGLNRYYNGCPGSYHKGVDIKAPQGQEIVALTNGKVLVAEQFRLHGGTIAIDHGQGVVSMYLHMSKIDVKEGQMVKEGDKIGEVGSTGISTGPHLHWGLYVHGTPVDPMGFWVKPVRKCS